MEEYTAKDGTRNSALGTRHSEHPNWLFMHEMLLINLKVYPSAFNSIPKPYNLSFIIIEMGIYVYVYVYTL